MIPYTMSKEFETFFELNIATDRYKDRTFRSVDLRCYVSSIKSFKLSVIAVSLYNIMDL